MHVGPIGGGQLQQATTDNIKARYRRKGLVILSAGKDPWPPFHANTFTNLALVHQKIKQLQSKEDTTMAARIRTKGDIHKIPELTSSIKLENVHQIFIPVTSDDQCPISILIEGHPGIGKTTLAKEICLQWANNELLTSDKLLLLLMLRDPNVQKITSTEELVKYTIPADQVQPVLSYLHNTKGAGVTFIIDGFDELSNELRHTSFFRKLIEGDTLHNARVVVTSRPSASACLHQCVDRRIEVLGFEKSSREQYIDGALKTSPSKLQTLKTHFQQYPNIDAMCYIPLNMAIIVFLCLLGSLPPTATKMFASFILHTVCRHLKRTGKIAEDECINKMEHLPQPVQQVLLQLQKIAFDGLVEDKIVFTVGDLPAMCRDDPTCYGLLQSVECYCSDEIGPPTKSFNFLHLGIQEYFAAKYVATLPEDEVYTLMKESFLEKQLLFDDPDPDSKSVRLSNMWIMYCGITSGQCKSLKRYLSYSKPSHSHSSRAFTTNHDHLSPSITHGFLSASCSSLPTTPTQPVRYPLTRSRSQNFTSFSQPLMERHNMYHPYQQQQLGYLPVSSHHDLNNSEHVTTNINTQVTSGKVTAPSQQGSASDQEISNTLTISQDILENPVKVLYLFQCFQEAQDDKLCEILSKSFDNGEIDLSYNSLLPHQVVSLGFFLSRLHRKWKELNLNGCDIGDHGINLLHHYLCGDKTNKQEIMIINLSVNHLTAASSSLIGDIITQLQPHTFKVGGTTIGEDGATAIAQAITNNKTLKKLIIIKCEITSTGATAIANSLLHNTSLEELDMSGNAIGQDGATTIAQAITNNKTLKKLIINRCEITSTEATAIANSLLHNTSLEVLYMSYNDIGQDGATAIAQAITNNKTLKKLIINRCEITSTGATAIANSLLHNTSLEELDMSGNAIGQDGATAIAQAITNNKTLKKLIIDNCEITSIGATAIANSSLHNTSLEVLAMGDNAIGEDGATAIAQAITNNKTLKKLIIDNCEITTIGATAITNSLLHNTSLEVLDMSYNAIGEDGATAIAQAITNNKTLKELYLCGHATIDEESAMIIMRSLYHNNSITELRFPYKLRHSDNVKREVEHINITRRKCNTQELEVKCC
ncbi:protein NLRC3-like [Dysidea avara]|uniref:protein NLRC3-like n=1 Tax=Dysidea avara TaxID=196820 RepID=UPI00331BEEFC